MAAPALADVVPVLDAAVGRRVLIFGSLPPGGRDLDLAVRPPEAAAVTAALEREGFTGRGSRWIRFARCSAIVVELVPAASLGVPTAEVEALFAEGEPLGESRSLVEPSPYHALLILSRRLARERGVLATTHRSRIDRALARDGGAWERAAGTAPLWGAETALERLRSRYLAGQPGDGERGRRPARRPRRARVIALSGPADLRRLHAEALSEALYRLGFDCIVERPDVAGVARLLRGRDATAVGRGALDFWRPLWSHLGRGRVILLDGSPLDVAVLAQPATAQQGLGRRARLLKVLAPNALRTYLVDGPQVPPELERSYRFAAALFGARRLERDMPQDDACARIAEDAWGALTRRGPVRSALRSLARSVRRRFGPGGPIRGRL